MSNYHECPNCGLRIGNMQVHPDLVCEQQQRINANNRGDICPHCGCIGENHKDGCPRKKGK